MIRIPRQPRPRLRPRSRHGNGFVVGASDTWHPGRYSPFAWYDANRGGTSTEIPDSSGFGRTAMQNGTTTAAALWLPYTSIPYLHLEAASAGTNSLSCTAPANTASYSAEPLDGGAATTDTAAAGAFTFSTAGDWRSVTLLDGSAVELARYDASLSTQTGQTDSHGVTWTVNRGTAGRKAVVLSSTAASARSMFLLGTNDKLTFPLAAIPPAGTADNCTIVIVGRSFATSPSGSYFSSTRSANAFVPGLDIRRNGTSANIEGLAVDSTSAKQTATVSAPHGQNLVMGIELSGANLFAFANGNVSANQTRTPGTNSATGPGTIGAVNPTVSSVFNDFEFIAWLSFDRALNASERAGLVAFYQGGL